MTKSGLKTELCEPYENEKTDEKTKETEKVPVLASCRLVTSYMCFLGMVLVFAARANIVMALVCLFPKEPDVELEELTAANRTWGTNGTGNNPGDALVNETLFAHWNDKTQGLALAAYNYGYLVSPILGGYIATKSAKYVMFFTMLVSAGVTVLTPFTMTESAYITIALRIVVGICGGVYEPCMQHLISSWAPKQERGKLTALTQSGKVVGNVVSFALSGVLCTITFLGGWPVPFYGTGILGVIWSLMVLYLLHDHPETHPRISDVEKEYIIKGLGKTNKGSHNSKKQRTPWLSIITSLPFIGCLLIKFAGAWVFNVQTLNQPMWVRDVLQFDVEQNGFLSALPYIGQFVGSLLAGIVLDFLTHTTWSTTAVRKFTFCVCLIFPGAAIFALAFLSYDTRILAVCLTVFTTTVYSAVPISLRLVIIEIAPRYTGILMGIVTTLGSIPGMVAPLIVSILTFKGTVDEWDEVFFMCSGMYVGAALLFLLIGSSEEQPWASGDKSDQEIDVVPDDTTKTESNSQKSLEMTDVETGYDRMRSISTVSSQNRELSSDTESACATLDMGEDNPGFSGVDDEKLVENDLTQKTAL